MSACVEPWKYEVDGETFEGRKVWHVESPGPVGCGVIYHEIDAKDALGEDNVWERHVYSWVLCGFADCPVPGCWNRNRAAHGALGDTTQ